MTNGSAATVDLHDRTFDFTVVDGKVRVSTENFTSALAVFDGQGGNEAMAVSMVGDEDAMRSAAEAYALRSGIVFEDEEDDVPSFG